MQKNLIILSAVVVLAICGALNVQADVIDADQARVIASEFLSNRHDGKRINRTSLSIMCSPMKTMADG